MFSNKRELLAPQSIQGVSVHTKNRGLHSSQRSLVDSLSPQPMQYFGNKKSKKSNSKEV